jgi:hypothetical protein
MNATPIPVPRSWSRCRSRRVAPWTQPVEGRRAGPREAVHNFNLAPA